MVIGCVTEVLLTQPLTKFIFLIISNGLTHIHHAVQVRVDLQGLVLEGVQGVHRLDITRPKFVKQLLEKLNMLASKIGRYKSHKCD